MKNINFSKSNFLNKQIYNIKQKKLKKLASNDQNSF